MWMLCYEMLCDPIQNSTTLLSIYQSLAILELRGTHPELQLFGHATWPHQSYKPLQVGNPQLPGALQNAKEPLLTKKKPRHS